MADSDYGTLVVQGHGLGQLFYRQAQSTPAAEAAIDGSRRLTYWELHVCASELAQQIRQAATPFALEEPVGVLVNHGIGDVVAQMAIVYAGGSCAPMNPNLPDCQIQDRLDGLSARCILVDEANAHRLPQGRLHRIRVLIDDARERHDGVDGYPIPTSLEHRTHLIQTSGTTSRPKAVQVLARSILHVVFHAPSQPVVRNDTVAHVNDTSFDVALFDVWGPLLRGARMAVIHKDVLLDMRALARLIDDVGITFMCTTTALLNLAAATHPTVFAALRVCFIGGEAANIPALRQIFTHGGAPGQLINAYGPTECCAWCLTHRIEEADVSGSQVSVPIGRPIGRTRAVILDETTWAPVPDGQEGELCIGGPGVSRGYLNLPQRDAEAFVVTGTPPQRLYRTGDIVRREASSGEIVYIGRRDQQVKIRGFRIELGAVETALLQTGALTEAVALKVESPVAGAGAMLVAFAVPKGTAGDVSAASIVDRLRQILPDYMIPRIHLLANLPLTRHAKIDRRQLEALYVTGPSVGVGTPSLCQDGHAPILPALRDIWATVLAIPYACCAPHDNFFLLGGTSLQASLLVDRIHTALGVRLSLLTFYDHPTPAQLSVVVSTRLAALPGEPADDTVKDDRDIWLVDSRLTAPLLEQEERNIPPPVDWTTSSEGRVFLTGATGFVGAFLLADLLQSPVVRQVGCLVRANSDARGMERIRQALQKYHVWQDGFASRLVIFLGTLEDEHLGLGRDGLQKAASWASVIFHLGARVNYTQPYSVHRPANVLGTLHVLRLSTACPGRVVPVHYVSSISCYGPTGWLTGATVVAEDDSLLPHLDALPYDHGYAQSQWVVEQMLAPLMRRGRPVSVYRPGFIMGHSVTGMCNPDDFVARLLTACCQLKVYPRLPRQRKEFVPVDYVVSSILHVAAHPSNLGRSYNLVPPRPELSVDMDATMELVQQVTGIPLRALPYGEWVDQLQKHTPRALKPLQPMLTERVYDGRSRWELYENMPHYKTDNLERALRHSHRGMAFPRLDATLMKRYLDFLEPRGIKGYCDECDV